MKIKVQPGKKPPACWRPAPCYLSDMKLPPFKHPVVRIALATSLLVASFAMYAPVLAILLLQHGHGTLAVGTFAMIGFACVALLIPFLPTLFERFGEVAMFQVGSVLWFVAGVGYALFDGLTIWSVFAVLGGLGAAAVWNATESLIARYSPAEQRGRITGLYQTLLGAALAVGPFVPALFQIDGRQTLIAVCIIQALGLCLVARLPPLPALQASAHPMDAVAAAMSTWQALRKVPALAALAFAGGVFEGGLSSVSAANGASMGMSVAAAASIAGALGIGSFLFQYPAGMLADRVLPSRVFGTAGFLLLASSAMMLPSASAPWLLWASAFIWGGVGGALYTLTMIRVAHQFTGRDTAAGTAAMIAGYTLGGAVGPVVSGAALQHFSVTGLASWLGALSVMVMGLSSRMATRKIHL
jgi:MFS family permease